eukprot:11562142-Alexandrium_andersonii.AAC.2
MFETASDSLPARGRFGVHAFPFFFSEAVRAAKVVENFDTDEFQAMDARKRRQLVQTLADRRPLPSFPRERAKDCADCGSADCGLRPRTPRSPLSSPDSESARRTAQNAPLGSFGDQFRGRSLARAVPGSNA